jgi:hypothetical protein
MRDQRGFDRRHGEPGADREKAERPSGRRRRKITAIAAIAAANTAAHQAGSWSAEK